MKLNLMVLLLVACVCNGRCDEVIDDFVECLHEIMSSNLELLNQTLKVNVEKLKIVFVRETMEHIDLLLAQFVDVYGDIKDDLKELAKRTVQNVTASMDKEVQTIDPEKNFGVEANLVVEAQKAAAVEIAEGIGDQRRGLLMNFKASVRNLVFNVINEPILKIPTIFGKFANVLNVNEKTSLTVAPPKKSRPNIKRVPEDFYGYMKNSDGFPVMVVQKIAGGHSCPIGNCYDKYVVDYMESIHDLISDDVNRFVRRYGQMAMRQQNINGYKKTLLSQLKRYTDECLRKLEQCQEVVDAIRSIYDNIVEHIEVVIKRVAEKY